MSEKIGSQIVNKGYFNKIKGLNIVGIYGKNSLEWSILEFGCILYNFTLVAVQNNAVKHIIEECELSTIFCSEDVLNDMINLDNNTIKTIICLQPPEQISHLLLDQSKYTKRIKPELQFNDSVQQQQQEEQQESFAEQGETDQLDTDSQEYSPKEYTLQQQLEMYALSKNKQLLFFKDIIASDNILPYAKVTPQSIYTICYTSGSTTISPKGAMITHANCVSSLVPYKFSKSNFFLEIFLLMNNCIISKELRVEQNDVYYSVLPMSHIYERDSFHTIIANGASIGFASKSMASQKEDLEVLQPTIYCSVPRLYNKVYQSIKEKIQNFDEGLYKKFFEYAINFKLSRMQSNGSKLKNPLLDTLLFSKIRKTFGGKIKVLFSGGAPLHPKVISFLEAVLCVPIVQGKNSKQFILIKYQQLLLNEGYGQTESTGAALQASLDENVNGTVGGPGCNMEFKIISCPELSYSSVDKDEKGNIHPRGEILLRGGKVFKGYFKDKKATKKTIDADGWLHTGDIGELNKNGSVTIIDRRNNIFKIPIGEFIVPEKIESVYSTKQAISEIFVYGQTDKNYIVAIIVPDFSYFQNILKQQYDIEVEDQGSENYREQVKNNNIFRQLISKSLSEGDKELLTYERIQQYHLSSDGFLTLGLFTSTGKISRQKSHLHFKQQIDSMYVLHDSI